MKVTVVAGGVPTQKYPIQGIFEYTQAKALATAGIEVCYLAIDFRPLNVSRHIGLKRFERDGIDIYHFSLPTGVYRRGVWFLQHLALRLFRKIEKEHGHQDIIHTHFYSISAICSLIPAYCDVKMVATEHSSKLNKSLSEISQLDRTIARAAYANASKVIAVSECLASRLNENFGIEPIVVGNIVNPSFATVKHVEHSGFNILSIGRLIAGKRFEDLIRAFASASTAVSSDSSVTDITLTIVGDGPLKNTLQALVNELGLSSKVTLLGGVDSDTILKIMASTDMFALLSESETFGVAYAEALSTGVPVLATRCGGPEGFVTKENGVLVGVGDIDAAAKAIDYIAIGKVVFNSDAIKRSATKFAPSIIAKKLIELYKTVL